MMTYTVMEISEGDDGAAERIEGTSDLERKTVQLEFTDLVSSTAKFRRTLES